MLAVSRYACMHVNVYMCMYVLLSGDATGVVSWRIRMCVCCEIYVYVCMLTTVYAYQMGPKTSLLRFAKSAPQKILQ